MRARQIRPGFWTSDDLRGLPLADRLLFIGLWCYVENGGVGEFRLGQVASAVFADIDDEDPAGARDIVRGGLERLARRGLVRVYGKRPAGGPERTGDLGACRWVEVTGFGRHQTIHPNAAKSDCPRFDPERHVLWDPQAGPAGVDPEAPGRPLREDYTEATCKLHVDVMETPGNVRENGAGYPQEGPELGQCKLHVNVIETPGSLNEVSTVSQLEKERKGKERKEESPSTVATVGDAKNEVIHRPVAQENTDTPAPMPVSGGDNTLSAMFMADPEAAYEALKALDHNPEPEPEPEPAWATPEKDAAGWAPQDTQIARARAKGLDPHKLAAHVRNTHRDRLAAITSPATPEADRLRKDLWDAFEDAMRTEAHRKATQAGTRNLAPSMAERLAALKGAGHA